MNSFLKVDVTVVKGHEGCREQLAEYFEELYNVPPPTERLAGGVQRAVVAPVTPTCQEAVRVVSELKGAELLGCAGSPPSCSRRMGSA